MEGAKPAAWCGFLRSGSAESQMGPIVRISLSDQVRRGGRESAGTRRGSCRSGVGVLDIGVADESLAVTRLFEDAKIVKKVCDGNIKMPARAFCVS